MTAKQIKARIRELRAQLFEAERALIAINEDVEGEVKQSTTNQFGCACAGSVGCGHCRTVRMQLSAGGASAAAVPVFPTVVTVTQTPDLQLVAQLIPHEMAKNWAPWVDYLAAL